MVRIYVSLVIVVKSAQLTYLINVNGMIESRTAMHPSNVDAHLGFSFSNICEAKRGKPAPNADLTIVLAANAELADQR